MATRQIKVCSSGKALDQSRISTLSRSPLVQNGSDLINSSTSGLHPASTTQNAPMGSAPGSSLKEPATSIDRLLSANQDRWPSRCCLRTACRQVCQQIWSHRAFLNFQSSAHVYLLNLLIHRVFPCERKLHIHNRNSQWRWRIEATQHRKTDCQLWRSQVHLYQNRF